MTRDPAPDILCIGSVLWDVIGRTASHMRIGSDVPGRIHRLPGGVAMNIAMTLVRFGLRPALLSALGRDAEGDELTAEAARMGMVVDHLYRSDDLPTDIYMAIEGANGLIAAIADAHSLEQAGDKILRPMGDGRLGSAQARMTSPKDSSTVNSNRRSDLRRLLLTLRSPGRRTPRRRGPHHPMRPLPPRPMPIGKSPARYAERTWRSVAVVVTARRSSRSISSVLRCGCRVGGSAQWNESPQAHDPPAFGLSIVKPCFSMVSEKSMVEPLR